MRILIDGDPIVYRAGFAAQNNWKILRWVDVTDDGDVEHEEFFAYVWERDAFIEDMNLHEDEIQLTEWIDPLPLPFALKITKDALSNIVKAIKGFLAEFGQATDTEVEVFLSGKTNFRNALATIPGSFTKDGEPVLGYKANRIGSKRPHHYQAIRDYMIEAWDATLFEGIEADDALAIVQWAEDEMTPKTIIATVDKDLRNVPGWHYDIIKQIEYLITSKQAQVHFYRQVLTGDRTDNIPGLYRVGEKKAKDLITEDMTENEMYNVCFEQYVTNINKYPGKHGPFGIGVEDPSYDIGIAAKMALLENARLLWMLQHTDQLWTPSGEPDASIADAGLLDEEEWA